MLKFNRFARFTRFASLASPTAQPRFATRAFPSIRKFNSSAIQSEKDNSIDLDSDCDNSFHGVSAEPFKPEISSLLSAPISPSDVELLPDGIPYLPEIKYRRILNKAFGPGAWALVPRGKHSISEKTLSREYALYCLGRFVSQARGEQDFFDKNGLATATEGVKSNALMRCCKDLGIASELWDPQWVRKFKTDHCVEVWAQNQRTNSKIKLWRKKDVELAWPLEEIGQVQRKSTNSTTSTSSSSENSSLKIGKK